MREWVNYLAWIESQDRKFRIRRQRMQTQTAITTVTGTDLGRGKSEQLMHSHSRTETNTDSPINRMLSREFLLLVSFAFEVAGSAWTAILFLFTMLTYASYSRTDRLMVETHLIFMSPTRVKDCASCILSCRVFLLFFLSLNSFVYAGPGCETIEEGQNYSRGHSFQTHVLIIQ